MSTRQLRKLQQQKELEALSKLAEQEESEEEPVPPPKPKASYFANLADLQDDDDEDEDSTHEQPEKTRDEKVAAEHNVEVKSIGSPTKRVKKWKKKRTGKKNAGKQPEAIADDHNDIDAVLRDLSLKEPIAGLSNHQLDPEYERVCRLLGVQTQHLKVANEMRNLFGKEVLGNHEDAGGRVRGNRRRQMPREVDLDTALKGHHAPGKGLSEVTLRRNNFIQGKDDWPKASPGGLTMELVEADAEDGTSEYKFVHNRTYQDLQNAFRGYVEIGDPQNLIGLLTRNPYHISLLLQVSKIAKDQSDHALSAELIERALFAFGRVALSSFNAKLAQGKARLDFARPENRELWLAGYQYIKALVMKGTYRTAFEWAKLLLSLDPEGDPYCMRLVTHHLALRAHEFNWLLDVSESALPSIWSPTGLDRSQAAFHTTPSLAFAALQLREAKETRRLLTDSFNRIPWLFTRLFKELSLDAPPSIWGLHPRTDAETLFTEIYVLQTKDLWNTPEATSLLMEIGHTIKTINIDSIPTLDNKELTLDVVRFVYLDNTPSLMAMVPSSLLHRENNSDSDPLPPDFNAFSYEAQRSWLQPHALNAQGGLGGDFMDPIAALGRIVPGFGALIGGHRPQEEEQALRRELEEYALNGNDDGEVDLENEGGQIMNRSVAQRLLAMLGWAAGGNTEYNDEGVDEIESGDEYHDAEDGLDSTDEEMPGLVPR